MYCPCDATYKLILLLKNGNLLIKALGEIVEDGSDYLVVGRPITQLADPVATRKEIKDYCMRDLYRALYNALFVCWQFEKYSRLSTSENQMIEPTRFWTISS